MKTFDKTYMEFQDYKNRLERYAGRFKNVKISVRRNKKEKNVTTVLKYNDSVLEEFYWWGDLNKVPRKYRKDVIKSINSIVNNYLINLAVQKDLRELHQISLFELGLE